MSPSSGLHSMEDAAIISINKCIKMLRTIQNQKIAENLFFIESFDHFLDNANLKKSIGNKNTLFQYLSAFSQKDRNSWIIFPLFYVEFRASPRILFTKFELECKTSKIIFSLGYSRFSSIFSIRVKPFRIFYAFFSFT